MSAREFIAKVKFDERGLVPVIAQELDGTVLMLAWANREALAATFREGRGVYWSRSRGALWRKGDTSGHVQEVREIALDCDGDAVLYVVRQEGPACHTGTRSCFSERKEIPWATIESRKADDGASKSYTRQLLETPPRIRRKIIEEAYEVNEAHQALSSGHDTKDHLAHEAADLLYHLFVLLASQASRHDLARRRSAGRCS